MVVRLGLPEGKVVRLQEALTWAFTGWSWSNATATLKEVSDVSQREDYPAPGSLYASYALLPELTEEEARVRDLAFFARFDALMSDACFRGDIALEGRRARSTQSEPIPSAYFFKPRGFSYFSGNKIDDTPANASVEAILDSGRDGEWEDAIVDREQFLSWFGRSMAQILDVSPDSLSEATVANLLKATTNRPAKLSAKKPKASGPGLDRVIDTMRVARAWKIQREAAGTLPATPRGRAIACMEDRGEDLKLGFEALRKIFEGIYPAARRAVDEGLALAVWDT